MWYDSHKKKLWYFYPPGHCQVKTFRSVCGIQSRDANVSLLLQRPNRQPPRVRQKIKEQLAAAAAGTRVTGASPLLRTALCRRAALPLVRCTFSRESCCANGRSWSATPTGAGLPPSPLTLLPSPPPLPPDRSILCFIQFLSSDFCIG